MGGVQRASTNVVLGPRASKWARWCPRWPCFFEGGGSLGPQHPGRQLGSLLISGGHNVSSGMLRGVRRPAKQTWDHLVSVFDLQCTCAAALTLLVTTMSSSTVITLASQTQPSLACRLRLLAIAALQNAVCRQMSIGSRFLLQTSGGTRGKRFCSFWLTSVRCCVICYIVATPKEIMLRVCKGLPACEQ